MEDTNRNISKDEFEVQHNDDIENIRQQPAAIHNKDKVAQEAVGGAYEEMPNGYYWSKGFIGTLTVRNLSSLCERN